jgi:hypothetical protein
MMVGLIEASMSDPGARAVWEGWHGKFVSALATSIECERDKGRAPEGPPAATLARLLVLMGERALQDASRRRVPRAEREELLDTMEAIWLAAVWGETPG